MFESLRLGLRRLLRRGDYERDLQDEVQLYVELEAQRLAEEGTPHADSLRLARAHMGGVEQMKETARSGGWEFSLESAWRDVRYAIRSLGRSPAYVAAALGTLAIGISGPTTVFALLSAVLFRPPVGVRAPEELVAIFTSDYSGPPYGGSSYPDFEVFRDQGQLFSGALLAAPQPAGIGEGDNLANAGIELVSADYFGVLGVTLAMGRGFVADEVRVGVPTPVAVISHAEWQQRFGGRPDIVGQSVRLNGTPFTIVGVAPPGLGGRFRGPEMSAWVPVTAATLLGLPAGESERGNRGYLVYARLKPGVTLEQARAGMETVGRNLAATYPDQWRDVTGAGRRVSVLPERETRIPPQVRGPALGFVALLFGATIVLLLVCAANVASLTLARTARRERELGVRLALGATRRRVVYQLLAESMLIAIVGAAGGAAITAVAMRALNAWQPPLPVPIDLDLRLDARVLLSVLAAAVATGIGFGLSPALRATRVAVVGMIRGSDQAANARKRALPVQGALVAAQVAMSMLLMVGAALFVRSLQAAAEVNPGFGIDRLQLLDVGPRADQRATAGAMAPTALEIQRRLASVPGVRAVSWGSTSPLSLGGGRRGIQVEGYEPAAGEDLEFHFNEVGPAYLSALRVPLAAGRDFEERDRAGSPPVLLVNEAFARRFWPGESALGKRVSFGLTGFAEVIGVVRNARLRSITEDATPYLFIPALQLEERRSPEGPPTVVMHVLTQGDPSALLDGLRAAVTEVALGWEVRRTRTMEQQLGDGLVPQRLAGSALSLFGGIAAFLAAVGLYGVVALAVASRRREIGIRMALGAQGREVTSLVVRNGLTLTGVGIVAGLAAGIAIAQLLRSFLIGDVGTSPVPFFWASLVLLATAGLAAWIPARRAARVSPMLVLRDD